jgi:predicted phosphodiesterase
MKLRIYSDIHLELPGAAFVVPELPDDKETVLILAGDINTGHNATEFIQPLLRQFRAVIYVLGNHEFYGSRVDKVQRLWKASNQHHENLHMLDDDVVVIDDVRFIGSTLWTDMDGGNPLAKMDAQQYLNDYRRITINDCGTYRKLQPMDTCNIHAKSKVFIQETLREEFDGKTVVVTHHAPLAECVHERYRGDPLNACYYSNLEAIFAEYDFNLWIHGHMHDPVDIKDVYGKDVRSNPVGYIGENLPGFDPELVVEV